MPLPMKMSASRPSRYRAASQLKSRRDAYGNIAPGEVELDGRVIRQYDRVGIVRNGATIGATAMRYGASGLMYFVLDDGTTADALNGMQAAWPRLEGDM